MVFNWYFGFGLYIPSWDLVVIGCILGCVESELDLDFGVRFGSDWVVSKWLEEDSMTGDDVCMGVGSVLGWVEVVVVMFGV